MNVRVLQSFVAVNFDPSGRYVATGYVDENYVKINE